MRQLVAALEKTYPDLTAQEIADILWLTLQQWQQSVKDTASIEPQPHSRAPTSGPSPTPTSGPSPTPTSGPSSTPTSGPSSAPTPGPSPTPTSGPSSAHTPGPSSVPTPVEQSRQTQKSMAGLTSRSKAVSASGSRLDAPLAVPDAPALRNSLELIKALRPLIRQVPSESASELDVPATVQAIAETNLWDLKTRPVLEPWLELALVVDATASMVIWQSTILNLRRALSQSGIFRDVRMWSLEPQRSGEPLQSEAQKETPELRLCIRAGFGPATKKQPSCRPQELLDPQKRRLVLVVSDCIAPYWETKDIRDVLQVWSDNGPMALVQVLPESLWERTNLLQVTRGQFYSVCAGQSSQDLNFVRRGQRRRRRPVGVKVPVFTLQPKVVERWSKMMVGTPFTPSPGLLFSPVFQDNRWASEDIQPDGQSQSKARAQIPPQRRLEKFRHFSTPMARRLVGLLAACPEINLPIIRMVQATMLPESRQSHVAEVLLGGLFKSQGHLTAHTPVDTIQYVFHEGVRPLIQDAVPPDRTFSVLSKWINRRLGYSLEDFVVKVNAFGPDEWEQMKPFAGVLVDLLKRRGERYKAIIKTLEEVLDLGIINLPLEDFPCESIKIIALPSEPTRISTTVTKYVRPTLSTPALELTGIKEVERVRFLEDSLGDHQSLESADLSRKSLSPNERLALFRALKAIPAHIFEEICVAIDVPSPVLSASASQEERALALFEWANSKLGCGLKVLKEAMEAVVEDHQLQSLLGSAPSSSPSSTMGSEQASESPELGRESWFPSDRLALLRTLKAMPAHIFEEIRVAIDAPSFVLPSAAAPQEERALVLLEWANGPTGCGLTILKETVDSVVEYHQLQSLLVSPPSSSPSSTIGSDQVSESAELNQESLPPDERLALLRTLKIIPAHIFEEIRVAIDAPSYVLPNSASQGERAVALFKWTNEPKGCGLTVLKEAIDSVVEYHQLQSLLVSSLSSSPSLTMGSDQEASESIALNQESLPSGEDSPLVRTLSKMPAHIFEEICVAIDTPSDTVPSASAPKTSAEALLEWANEPEGCGLTVLKGAIDSVIEYHRLQSRLVSPSFSSPSSTMGSDQASELAELSWDSWSPLERLTLMRTLNAIPTHIFEKMCITIGAPSYILPSASAPQEARTSALLEWAGSPMGCGSTVLKETVDSVVEDHQLQFLVASSPASSPSSTMGPDQTSEPTELSRDSWSPQERLTLIRTLNAIPAHIFAEMCIIIGAPSYVLPSSSAPQARRIAALLKWAEAEIGCGLTVLKEAIDSVVEDHQLQSLLVSSPSSSLSSTLGTDQASASTELSRKSWSVHERLTFIRTLNVIPAHIFEEICIALGVPSSLLPSASASQGDRTSDLLQWAESPIGCGSTVLKETVDAVVEDISYNLR